MNRLVTQYIMAGKQCQSCDYLNFIVPFLKIEDKNIMYQCCKLFKSHLDQDFDYKIVRDVKISIMEQYNMFKRDLELKVSKFTNGKLYNLISFDMEGNPTYGVGYFNGMFCHYYLTNNIVKKKYRHNGDYYDCDEAFDCFNNSGDEDWYFDPYYDVCVNENREQMLEYMFQQSMGSDESRYKVPTVSESTLVVKSIQE